MFRILPRSVDFQFIGKVELFDADLAHLSRLLGRALPRDTRVNASGLHRAAAYFTPELRKLVQRAYEEDFDRFEYPR